MPSFSDPLALFHMAIARSDARDFLGVAHCCDPVSLRAFHRGVLEQFSAPTDYRPQTLDDVRRYDPDMPIEVAEYELKRRNAQVDRRDQLSRELPGVASIDTLRTMSADAVFAAFLDGRSIRRQMERMVADGHAPPQLLVDLEAHPFPPTRLTAIGCVGMDGPIASIVYRFGTPPATTPVTLSARDHRDLEAHQQRLAALPLDEQELAKDCENGAHAMTTNCRRQPDGGWLLLADYSFPGAGFGHVVGMAGVDDEGDDEIDAEA